MTDLNVEYDYSLPLLRAEQASRRCLNAIINKRDLEAAAEAADDLVVAATHAVKAVAYLRLQQRLAPKREAA